MSQSRGEVEGGGIRWAKVRNLQSEAGRKLNGKLGKVMTSEVNSDGRHQVQVEGIRRVKLVKPANLEDVADADLVRVYRIPSNGEGEIHQVLVFPREHSLFQNNAREGNSPALGLCGLPLVVQQTQPRRPLGDRANFDNVWATWLMIDPNSGLAPPEWDSYVGPVYVFRPNGSADVTGDDMYAVNEFLSSLLDEYGEGPDFDPRTWLNPEFFLRFVRNFKSERQELGSALQGLTLLEEQALDRELAAQMARMLWRRD